MSFVERGVPPANTGHDNEGKEMATTVSIGCAKLVKLRKHYTYIYI